MNPYRWVIAGLWLLYLLYWAVAAVGVKRSAGGRRWSRELGLRLVVIVVMFLLLRSRSVRQIILESQRFIGRSNLLGVSGVVLCSLGFGLAISARRHLGRNWGIPMSRKQDAELITSGPYAFIRHPIYTGLMLAMLGSALGFSLFWALMLLVAGPYFVYSAQHEEAFMSRLFPERYAAYRARTGMLVPCPLGRR
jgi:protein-S-isoprenylcysteine O-methyltransferase Ste14